MGSFIKRHWRAYLIGAIIAILLGLGAAVFVGVKASTPADVRAQHIAAEQTHEKSEDTIAKDEKADASGSSTSGK